MRACKISKSEGPRERERKRQKDTEKDTQGETYRESSIRCMAATSMSFPCCQTDALGVVWRGVGNLALLTRYVYSLNCYKRLGLPHQHRFEVEEKCS